MKKTVQNNQNGKVYGYIILGLIFILLVVGLFLTKNNAVLKDEINSQKEEISELKSLNKSTAAENSKLTETIKYNTTDSKEIELEKKYQKVAEEFIKLYPYYDVKTIKDKKENLLKFAAPEVAASIVPDDMIKDSELLNDSPENASELYSTDPTFKSFYNTSSIYKEYVSPTKYKYFAIVNYGTTSAMGDTENVTYLQFEVENVEDNPLVTNYKIYYMN